MGIMLVYTCQLIDLFQWCVRQSCEVENYMTSVERILEYVSLPDENYSEHEKRKPSREWPKEGEIVFEDVSFTYDAQLPPALNNVSFRIESGEKIGVVGRTGAGKSTLIQALFRMAEPSGLILIDQVNIKSIDLKVLRSKISIIPVS